MDDTDHDFTFTEYGWRSDIGFYTRRNGGPYVSCDEMICECCKGKGRIYMVSDANKTIEGMPLIMPCPECNQQGITYCCDPPSEIDKETADVL